MAAALQSDAATTHGSQARVIALLRSARPTPGASTHLEHINITEAVGASRHARSIRPTEPAWTLASGGPCRELHHRRKRAMWGGFALHSGAPLDVAHCPVASFKRL